MQVATYVDGRTVDYDEQSRVFSIGGIPVTVEQVISYDRASQLAWLSADLRNWVYQCGAAANPAPVAAALPKTPGKGLVVGGGILAAFGLLVCIIATPVLGFLGVTFGSLLSAIGLYMQAVGDLRPSKMGWGNMTALGVLVCFLAATRFFVTDVFHYFFGQFRGDPMSVVVAAGAVLAAIGLTMLFLRAPRPRKSAGGIVTALGVLIFVAVALTMQSASSSFDIRPGLVLLGVLLAVSGFAVHVIGKVGYRTVAGQVVVASGVLVFFVATRVIRDSLPFPVRPEVVLAGSALGIVVAIVGFVMQIRGTGSRPQPM